MEKVFLFFFGSWQALKKQSVISVFTGNNTAEHMKQIHYKLNNKIFCSNVSLFLVFLFNWVKYCLALKSQIPQQIQEGAWQKSGFETNRKSQRTRYIKIQLSVKSIELGFLKSHSCTGMQSCSEAWRPSCKASFRRYTLLKIREACSWSSMKWMALFFSFCS